MNQITVWIQTIFHLESQMPMRSAPRPPSGRDLARAEPMRQSQHSANSDILNLHSELLTGPSRSTAEAAPHHDHVLPPALLHAEELTSGKTAK